MQLHLCFHGSQVNLPIAYRHTQQGLIYSSLINDEDYAAHLHDNGFLAQQRKFKLFTFSPFSGSYTIQNKRIIFHNSLVMEIRSADPHMIHQLEQRLVPNVHLLIAGNPVVLSEMRTENTHIEDAEIYVQTVSPIVVYQTQENGQSLFFSPDNAEFVAGIIHNAQRKWYSLHSKDTPFSLDVQILPHIKPRKVPTVFKGTYITGWHCTLRLSGLPEVLDMLYQTGLGAKSSQGFGMFRMLR